MDDVDEWIEGQKERPRPIVGGIRLFTQDGDGDDWKARKEALTQKVRAEARERFEDGGIETLRRLHDALGERIQEKVKARNRIRTRPDYGASEFLKSEWQRADRTVAFLEFRQDVIRDLLERDEYGLRMPWEESEGVTDDAPACDEELPNIFEGRPKTLDYAEAVVEKYRKNPGSLPESVTKFRAWIGRDGDSKHARLQTVIREAELSHLYEDGNPQSFCDLLERLVRRHYAE